MKLNESLNVEFKEIYVDDIKKDVIAFVNTDGGNLYIGVSDNGETVGVDNTDTVMLQVASALKDAIKPDVMPFVQIKTVQKDDKAVVEVSVSVGTNRPYYLQEKGLKPSGVYVRRGSASQPLSDEGIREMIIQNSGISFEKGRSLNQDLTFEVFEREMEKLSMKIATAQMRTLHMIGEDGLFTNLALLLSDQCEHSIKVALFQGKDKAVFRDRREFTGSLLRQLEEVYQFIDLNNKTKALFSGLTRTDVRDYPEEAVREALLNSIVHRDYSFSGSILINLYDDRMELVSLGGLVPGLSMEAIFIGVSQSRNPSLASIFYRMRLIESYGTGISKIQRLYQDALKKPVFETAKGVFRTTLPNRNDIVNNDIESGETLVPSNESKPYRLHREKEMILEYALEKGYVTRKEVEELIEVKTTKAFRLLRELCDEGVLKAEGSGKLSRYVPL